MSMLVLMPVGTATLIMGTLNYVYFLEVPFNVKVLYYSYINLSSEGQDTIAHNESQEARL